MLKLPALDRLPEWLADVPSLTELAKGSTVWLAVTGLSRAGKTVFITSLVHNLLSALHNPNRMPLLKVVGEGRLIAARQEGAKAHLLPRFPYAANIEAMAKTPAGWPERTADISEIGVDIRFVPSGLVGEVLGRVSGGAACAPTSPAIISPSSPTIRPTRHRAKPSPSRRTIFIAHCS